MNIEKYCLFKQREDNKALQENEERNQLEILVERQSLSHKIKFLHDQLGDL